MVKQELPIQVEKTYYRLLCIINDLEIDVRNIDNIVKVFILYMRKINLSMYNYFESTLHKHIDKRFFILNSVKVIVLILNIYIGSVYNNRDLTDEQKRKINKLLE